MSNLFNIMFIVFLIGMSAEVIVAQLDSFSGQSFFDGGGDWIANRVVVHHGEHFLLYQLFCFLEVGQR